MEPLDFPVSDIEEFAEHLGMTGIDSDLFYESLYIEQSDEYDDYESHWDEVTESIETY